ncbi:NADP-dependent oxidoreductase domain-containing protein, partial [Cadophora sp. MPI-SDFR-AT-0126]
MSTKLVPLGKNGPMIPQLGFGTMGLTYAVYGQVASDEERFRVLDRAYEIGARNWDSSDLYGDGEELIGKWFKRTGKRDEIFLATKFGFVKGAPGFQVDSSAEFCKKACNESLRLLDIDCIDLYYMHHADPKVPIEQTMRALAELQKEGKIKHIGLSAISSSTLRRAVKIAPVAAVQTDYSVFTRDIENSSGTDLLSTCRELGVAVVAAMPLGRGILTSTFAAGEYAGVQDMRTKAMPRFTEANQDANIKLVSQFKAFADKKGCTVAQLAIAWLLKQGDDIIPIPGTKRIKYLEENWDSLKVQLTDEDEKEIRKFVEGLKLAGAAVPDGFADDLMFRNTAEE